MILKPSCKLSICLSLCFISLILAPNTAKAQVGAFDFYRVSSSGSDKISVTQREFARLSLSYREKKINNWYEKFWERENLTSPENCYVRIVDAPLHSDAFLIAFEIDSSIVKIDTTYEIHERIVTMMIDDLHSKIVADSTHLIQWMAAISTSYKGEKERKTDKQIANSANLTYIRPKNADVSVMSPPTNFGTKSIRISTLNYAMHYMAPVIEDLHLVYKQFLDFSGLRLYQHAEIVMEENRLNSDMISFVIKADSLTIANDPKFIYHRDMAKQLHAFLVRKSAPIKTKWLRFRFEIEPEGDFKRRVLLFE